jgi:hypothetical protein
MSFIPPRLGPKFAVSTLCVFAAWVATGLAAREHGAAPVILWYVGPLMWNQAWLVAYTWLQHTDPTVPLYGPDEWTCVRGALSTVDLPYGVFDFFHHKIGSTHVAHHIFHEMPFYEAHGGHPGVPGTEGAVQLRSDSLVPGHVEDREEVSLHRRSGRDPVLQELGGCAHARGWEEKSLK